MNTVWRLAGIATLAFLAACSNLTAEHPIGGTLAGKPDARLIGVWKFATRLSGEKKAGEAGYMFVSRKKGGSELHAVLVGWSATEPTETLEFDVATGTLSGTTFVNLHNAVENGKPATKDDLDGYVPYVYRFEMDGHLMIYDHTDAGMDLIKHAVASGHLHGTVMDRGSRGKDKNTMASILDIHLTSDQKALDSFFAANGKTVFTDLVDAFEPVKVP